MQAFTLMHLAATQEAIAAGAQPRTKYIAGGTDLLQLAKDTIETPHQIVDLEPLGMNGIEVTTSALRLGAMARMSDVAAHPAVMRDWPVLSQALLASASPQIRNMGTMGGNLLQRTRCGYFRDSGFACNKRDPGSGCPAIVGENRMHAILGVSDHCIATYPGDMAVALTVLGAQVEITGAAGIRRVSIADFHVLPGETPHVETVLQAGDLVTAIEVPASAAAKRSHYLKIRDRASFEFAVVSAAVALEIDDGTIRHARVAAGGVGTRPWHLPEVEFLLIGKPARPGVLKAAADAAGDGAKPARDNAFKLVLLRRTVLRALQTISA